MNRFLVKSIFSLFSTSYKPSSPNIPIITPVTQIQFAFGKSKDPVNGKNDQTQDKDSMKLSK